MPSRKIQLPHDTISLSSTMADTLLRKGSGDAALLYLYLLRHDGYYDPEEAARTMHWERTQLDGAMVLLRELGVQTGEEEEALSFTNPIPKKEDAPEYSNEDVAQALQDTASGFPALLGEVQTLLNKQLPPRELRILLELYDHLGLPAEVLVLLVSHECELYKEKYGEGRRPPMSYIRSSAYRWRKNGIDTLDAATSYLSRLDYYRSREGELLSAVGIRGRKATATERNYLSTWAEWGFSTEAVAVAYDRTVTSIGKMRWNYCNAILERWHSENRHTLEEVQASLSSPSKTPRSRNALQVARSETPQEIAEHDRLIEENQRSIQALLRRLDSQK